MMQRARKGKLFKAGDFCRVTGITGETLRHYVDRGIIEPADIAPNSYRMYSERNAMDMLLTRSCRGLDLPLSAILRKEGSTIGEQEALFAEQEKRLEVEIASLESKLLRVRQQRVMIEAMAQAVGTVRERSEDEVFNLYRLIVFGKDARITEEAMRALDQWLKFPQYVCVALNAPRASLLDGGDDALPISVGLGVREAWAIKLGLDTRPPVSFFARHRNICTVVRTSDPFNLHKSDLNGIFDEVARLGAEIASDLTGIVGTCTETEQGRLYYISLGFSIK